MIGPRREAPVGGSTRVVPFCRIIHMAWCDAVPVRRFASSERTRARNHATLLLFLIMGAQQTSAACHSSKEDDLNVEKCEPWCEHGDHCGYCKCRACKHLGCKRCHSTLRDDISVEDCESWCEHGDHCKETHRPAAGAVLASCTMLAQRSICQAKRDLMLPQPNANHKAHAHDGTINCT